MKRTTQTLLWLGIILAAPGAMAGDLELGLFYGQRLGGEIGAGFSSDSQVSELSVDEGDAHGFTVEYTFANQWRMEFIWDRQDSWLLGDPDGAGSVPLAPIQLTSYLLGGNYYFSRDSLRPYLGFHVGATTVDSGGLSDHTRGAFSLGLGSKYALTEHLLLDLRLRWVATWLDSNSSLYCRLPGECYTASQTDLLDQAHVTLGLNFRY